MNINDAMLHAQEVWKNCEDPDCALEHGQLAEWLQELKECREASGVSIGIVTYNSLSYNKAALAQIRKHTHLINHEILFYDNGSHDGSVEWLDEQSDVRLFRGANNDKSHGLALDYLVGQSTFPIFCSMCSDAFPISHEWLTPAMYVSESTVLAGIDRGWGRKLKHYICPSYLFGWREWLLEHSFADNWPTTDTGEKLGVDCLAEGKEMKMWNWKKVDFGEGIKPKQCNYNDWVWHTKWGTRKNVVPGLAGQEFEADYPQRARAYIKDNFGIDV